MDRVQILTSMFDPSGFGLEIGPSYNPLVPKSSGARIETIDSDALLASMAAGEIAVIPGFQGLSPDDRVTPLGRGGSDTTGVAMAAALNSSMPRARVGESRR